MVALSFFCGKLVSMMMKKVLVKAYAACDERGPSKHIAAIARQSLEQKGPQELVPECVRQTSLACSLCHLRH